MTRYGLTRRLQNPPNKHLHLLQNQLLLQADVRVLILFHRSCLVCIVFPSARLFSAMFPLYIVYFVCLFVCDIQRASSLVHME